MTKVRAVLEDRPFVITLLLLVAVSGHALAAHFRDIPAPVERLVREAGDGTGVSIALGLASVAAIAAGFAGAIIVFGISGDTAIMRQFRLKTARALRANWVSVIGSSFLSAVLSLIAAGFVAAQWYELSAPTLTFGLLLLIHSLLRMMWLFGVLLSLVTTQDQRDDRRARTRTLSDIFRNRAA
ncbi:hypothetical protein [Rhodococcus sp. KRD162]|uniref:hypothetical protein n=1 Tax=Rhodococcus sp. KRD162 TaxID=2729725 RepID=UPI0019D19CBB|nr:hypothetical protein [Rhodococcus sp. KRD162]